MALPYDILPGDAWPGDNLPDSRASACIRQLRLNDACRIVWLTGKSSHRRISELSHHCEGRISPAVALERTLKVFRTGGTTPRIPNIPHLAPYFLPLHFLSRWSIVSLNTWTCTRTFDSQPSQPLGHKARQEPPVFELPIATATRRHVAAALPFLCRENILFTSSMI